MVGENRGEMGRSFVYHRQDDTIAVIGIGKLARGGSLAVSGIQTKISKVSPMYCTDSYQVEGRNVFDTTMCCFALLPPWAVESSEARRGVLGRAICPACDSWVLSYSPLSLPFLVNGDGHAV